MSANTSNLDPRTDGARLDLSRPDSEHLDVPLGTQRRTPRWVVVLLGMLGALAVWAVGTLTGVASVVVDTGAAMQQVTAVSVVVASLVAGLAGWGVRIVLGRIDRNVARARVIWLLLSGAVLLVSLLGVMGATTTGALLVLLAEHLVVGLVLMIGLRR